MAQEFSSGVADINGQCAIPYPRSAREANLLLEAARADQTILLTHKKLTHQIIHRNILVLQYNRILLERTQDDLHAVDQFVGHVRLMIRRSGQTAAAFEYATRTQEDYAQNVVSVPGPSGKYTAQTMI